MSGVFDESGYGQTGFQLPGTAMMTVDLEITDAQADDNNMKQALLEQYRVLFENAVDVIYSVDADFRILYVSPSIEKHLGYTPEELCGKPFTELGLLTEDSLGRAVADTMRIINGEVLDTAEYELIAKDGTRRIAEIRSTPVHKDGIVTSIVSVARDITAQRKAEQALSASEDRFRTMAEKINDGLIIMEEGTIVYVNDNACKLCGYPREELIALWGPDLTASESYRDKVKILQESREMGVYPDKVDTWITRKDGTQCCLNLRFSFDYSSERKQSGYVLMTDITERRRIREKMQDTMNFLDDIIGKAVDAIVITEPEGFFKRVNRSFLDLTGYTEEEVIGKRVAEISAVMGGEYESSSGEHITIDQEYMNYTLRMAEQLLDEKKIVNWESYLLRKDGIVVPISMNITYLFGEKGDVTGCVGILRDNTERKKVEKEIIETRDFLDNIIESSIDPIVIGDGLGNITRVNKAFVQLIGFGKEELVGKHLAELVPPRPGLYESSDGTMAMVDESFYDRAYEKMKMLIETGHLSSWESYYYNKSGWIVPVEQTIFYLYDKKGERKGVVTINRDITERKSAEHQLIEARNFLGDIIRTSADGIVVTDTIGTIRLVNDAVERITGYPQERLVGSNIHDYMTIPDGKMRTDFVETPSGKTDSVFYFESEWRRKGGGHIEVGMSVGILRDIQGNTTGMVSCIQDISDRKTAERKLYDYQNQLRCLASQLTLTEEQERKRVATEIHDHISQSLALAKIKLGALAAAKTVRDRAREISAVRELLEQCIRDTRSLIFNLSPPFLYEFGLEKALEWLLEEMEKQYGIKTRLVCTNTGGSFDDDVSILLYQSIRELLINVVKHAHAKNAAVFLDKNTQMIHVSVEDDGNGFVISPEGFTVSKNGGFGIFSIRERFQYLGGSLTVKSKLHQGTRIAMELPLAQQTV
jgi:PAS domain S-box-containing protein